MSTARIRPALAGDVPELNDLYNHYVVHTPITFDVEPSTLEARRAWFGQFESSGPRRLLVAEEGGRVCGYAGTLAFRPKAAYRTSAETTIYLHPDATGRGLGSRLYAALFEAVAGSGLHRAYAGITLPNERSIALHRSFGFRPVGVFREVGHKLGRFWDVQWFEKDLGDTGKSPGGDGV